MRLIPILFLLLITGCSGQSEDKDSSDFNMEGIVYSLNDDYILVVSDITSTKITREQWFEQGKPATNFKITKDTEIIGGKIKVGSNVKVWDTGWEDESYPSTAEAKKILVTN